MAKLLLDGVSPASIPDRLNLEGEALSDAVSAMHVEMLPEDGEKALEFAQECLKTMQRNRLDTKYNELMDEYTNATGERHAQLKEQLLLIESQRARLEQDRKG